MTHQYEFFLHSRSSRTTLTISPSILFSLSSAFLVSTKTYPPRLIQIVLRKREGSSTRTSVLFERTQEYKLFPVALMTRAMRWVGVKESGGVEVSTAAACTLRFGLPILEVGRWPASLAGQFCESSIHRLSEVGAYSPKVFPSETFDHSLEPSCARGAARTLWWGKAGHSGGPSPL